MSWGVETQGFFGRLPIDQDFDNLVYRKQGSRWLGTGYHVIPLESRGVASLVVAARHPGLDVALLGYTNDAYGTTGIRLYVRGTGTFYWRTYESAYPLPVQGWGMVVYNVGGKQTFHSDHRYADVKNSRYYIGSSKMPLSGHYYLLNTPATPTFEYETYQNSWYSEDIRYRQTGTRRVYRSFREYQCWSESGFVNGRFQSWQECGYVTVWRWVEEPTYGFVTVGYWVSVEAIVYCTKHISMVRHSSDDTLSEYRHRTHNRQTAYSWFYRYYDSVSPIYQGGNWVYREFLPVYQGHLRWLTSPAYTGITGHSNKLIMLR